MTGSTMAIHIAKAQLSLDDDSYRAKLFNITGKTSTKDMSERERQQVLSVFVSEGFEFNNNHRRDSRQKLTGKYAAKLQALWIAGWNLGVVRNRDDAALQEFVCGRTGLEAVRFCHDPNDARKAIEALKAMLARAGVDWTIDNSRAAYTQTDGYRVACAQTQILRIHYSEFWTTVWAIADLARNTVDLPRPQWIAVMNELGKRVRAAKKAGAP